MSRTVADAVIAAVTASSVGARNAQAVAAVKRPREDRGIRTGPVRSGACGRYQCGEHDRRQIGHGCSKPWRELPSAEKRGSASFERGADDCDRDDRDPDPHSSWVVLAAWATSISEVVTNTTRPTGNA